MDQFLAHYPEEGASLSHPDNVHNPGPLSITYRPDVVL